MSAKIAPCHTTLSIHRFSSITPQPLDWLWPSYLPKGKLSLLMGDPASGKTALALELAGRLSTASPMPPFPMTPHETTASPNPSPDENEPPKNASPQSPVLSTHSSQPPFSLHTSSFSLPRATLLLSPEDNAADSLRPRLDALGANNDLIHLLPDLHSLTNDSHLAALTTAIEELPNLSLVIIDPITYYLGQTDRILHHPDAYTARSILHALAQLAARFELAILLTSRLTKRLTPNSPNFLRHALGSLAYTSIPRTIHLLTPYTPKSPPPPRGGDNVSSQTQQPVEQKTPSPQNHPVTPSSLLLPLKTPATQLPPPLAFSIADTITWLPTPASLSDLAPPPDAILQQAIDFLRTYLAHGPCSAQAIQNSAGVNVISRRTLARAKAVLNLQTFRQGFQGPWYWALPGDSRKPFKPPSGSHADLPNDPDLLMKMVASIGKH